MELYIGGYAQGKTDYVKSVHRGEELRMIEDYRNLYETGQKKKGTDRIVICGLHSMTRELLEVEKDPKAFFETVFEQHPDCIVICDEVGSGIVPISRQERDYRDAVGEIMILAAKRADRVERVICGLGQRIK